MAFDGYSCLLFLMDVRDEAVPLQLLRRLLYRHARVCHCTCEACIELRQRHEQYEQEALH